MTTSLLPVLTAMANTLNGLLLGMVIRPIIEELHFSRGMRGLIVVGLILAGLAINLLSYLLRTRHVKIKVDATPLSSSVDKKEHARKGLIIFLSLLSFTKAGWKQLESKKKKMTPEDIQSAVAKLDYDSLLLENDTLTNFGLTTSAIRTHLLGDDQNRLKHLWIVTSVSKRDPQQASIRFLELYKKFLRDRILVDRDIEIYGGEEYQIDIDEESQVVKKTSDKLQKIYAFAERKLGLKPEEIIVDVTSGTSHMTTGAVLGSMQRERDIELFYSKHKAGEGVIEAVVPVIVQYEPEVHLQ